MSYQPLVLAQSSNCIRVDVIPTGFVTREFDTTFPIALQGIMSPEEFLHHVSNLNLILRKAGGRIRVSILLMIITFVIFGIVIGILASFQTDITPFFSFIWFVIIIITMVVRIVRSSRACQEELRHQLEHINKDAVPRGSQWRLHQTYHHTGRSYYLEIDANRTTVVAPTDTAPIYQQQTPVYSAPVFNQPMYYAQPPAYNQPIYPPTTSAPTYTTQMPTNNSQV
ncbi:hypothetical protein HMI54_010217 [Coelomomyces lativittatus]|nr:hypothetical protein HMI54_010217 [Coelomomyces lativittatus]